LTQVLARLAQVLAGFAQVFGGFTQAFGVLIAPVANSRAFAPPQIDHAGLKTVATGNVAPIETPKL